MRPPTAQCHLPSKPGFLPPDTILSHQSQTRMLDSLQDKVHPIFADRSERFEHYFTISKDIF